MVATEPLPADMWDEIGLAGFDFADDRRMVVYGQRTTDDRIAFGGRGAPYLFGSAVRTDHSDPAVSDRIVRSLHELLPIVADVPITHRWGGVLGIPRDWRPSVGLDRSAGLAWAGGYVGEGVAAANLAGRTLADLILEHDSDLTSLPWVDHRSRRWEPEPLRWIGITSMLRLTALADRSDDADGPTVATRRTRRPPPLTNQPAAPLGSCWVMQWIPPPPNASTRLVTPTTSRSGNASAMIASASGSFGWSAVGTTMPPLAT